MAREEHPVDCCHESLRCIQQTWLNTLVALNKTHTDEQHSRAFLLRQYSIISYEPFHQEEEEEIHYVHTASKGL